MTKKSRSAKEDSIEHTLTLVDMKRELERSESINTSLPSFQSVKSDWKRTCESRKRRRRRTKLISGREIQERLQDDRRTLMYRSMHCSPSNHAAVRSNIFICPQEKNFPYFVTSYGKSILRSWQKKRALFPIESETKRKPSLSVSSPVRFLFPSLSLSPPQGV